MKPFRNMGHNLVLLMKGWERSAEDETQLPRADIGNEAPQQSPINITQRLFEHFLSDAERHALTRLSLW